MGSTEYSLGSWIPTTLDTVLLTRARHLTLIVLGSPIL